jgi:hypothetical protein
VNNQSLTRREFASRALSTVATAGTAAALRETALGGDKPAVEARRPLAADVEDHLLAVIRGRYPDPRLSPEVLREIRRDVAGDVERSRALSNYVLHNSDEPAFVFAAYRGDAIR